MLPAQPVCSFVELSAHMLERDRLKFLNLNKLASLFVKRLHVLVQSAIYTIHLINDQLRVSLNEKPLHHPFDTESKTICYADCEDELRRMKFEGEGLEARTQLAALISGLCIRLGCSCRCCIPRVRRTKTCNRKGHAHVRSATTVDFFSSVIISRADTCIIMRNTCNTTPSWPRSGCHQT